MKKIIVDGKSRNKTHVFKCPNKDCGCVFKADKNDYWYLKDNKESNTITDTVASQCPSCCNVVTKHIVYRDKYSILKKILKTISKSNRTVISIIGLLLNITIFPACITVLCTVPNAEISNGIDVLCGIAIGITLIYNIVAFTAISCDFDI